MQAKYLYCVADAKTAGGLGPIGLEGSEVRPLIHRGLLAVVHDCPARPYDSHDEGKVRDWVLAHQRVVEAARERFGDILPCRFNTMVRGNAGESAEGNLRLWMEGERPRLEAGLARVRGKAEYGVQVSWDLKAVTRRCLRTKEELRRLQDRISSLPEGAAYLHRKKLEGLLRAALSAKAEAYFQRFYDRIREVVEDVYVGRNKEMDGGRQMILNLSTLVRREKAGELAGVLESIRRWKELSVSFTGPWPPYSFS